MLDANDLECQRGTRRLFAGISFALAPGECLQVQGANGSGKTSLLRIICGLLAPDAGDISWRGRGVRELGDEYRASLAWIGHLNAVKDELDPGENLRYSAQVAGVSTTAVEQNDALRTFGLGGARLPCKLLSQGQKRRAALARLKVFSARALWVLDEPFTALDAEGVSITRTLIEAQLARGGAVMFTTHQDVAFTGQGLQRVDLSP
jgi:heme exporter protein A